MRVLFRRIYAWFFERGPGHGAAALRIGFAFIYLYMLWDLYPTMDLVMGHNGLFGTLEKNYFNLSNPLALLYRFDLPWQLQVWFWASVLGASLALVGFWSRLSIPLTFFSILLFQARGPYLIYGADKVLLDCFFWLLFLDCGRCWSLDRRFRLRRHQLGDKINLWPVKAIAIQIAIIYLYTGLYKLTTDLWLDGSAIFYAVQVRSFGWMQALDLTPYRIFFGLLTYATLFIEIGFAFFVFLKPTKKYMLLAGLLLHLGIDAMMHIRFFSLTMFMGYLAYIEPTTWNRLAVQLSAFYGRMGHFLSRLRPSLSSQLVKGGTHNGIGL